MESEELEIRIRAAKQLDIEFICHSHLKSFRQGGFFSSGIPNKAFYHYQHKVLESLLPSCTVLVACDSNQPDVILGWCIAQKASEALIIHYMYTKKTFRRMGVAKRLYKYLTEETEPGMVVVTHMTPIGKLLASKVTAFYNPYQLFINLPRNWSNDAAH